MIDILKSSDTLVKTFASNLIEEDDAETILEILLEGRDSLAQKHVGRVMKYMLCKLKMLEKEDIEEGTKESYMQTYTDDDGKETEVEEERYKALSLQILQLLIDCLDERAPKAWKTFDQFNELFFAFGVFSPEDIQERWTGETTISCIPFDKESEAYQIGMGLFFRWNMLERLGDFVLGDKSPMHEVGTQRWSMGTQWLKPNFSALMGVVTTMMTDRDMIERFPLSENSQKIISS